MLSLTINIDQDTADEPTDRMSLLVQQHPSNVASQFSPARVHSPFVLPPLGVSPRESRNVSEFFGSG